MGYIYWNINRLEQLFFLSLVVSCHTVYILPSCCFLRTYITKLLQSISDITQKSLRIGMRLIESNRCFNSHFWPTQSGNVWSDLAGSALTWWRYPMETLSPLLAFFRGIHRWPVDSPHKGPVNQVLMFSFILTWTKNRSDGDLRCNDARGRSLLWSKL